MNDWKSHAAFELWTIGSQKVGNHSSSLNELYCSNFHNCCSTHTHTCSLSHADPQLWQLSWRSLGVNHCTNHSWDVFHLTGESSLWTKRQETSQANKSFKTCLCTLKTSCRLYKHTLCNTLWKKGWGYISYHCWVVGFHMSSELRAKQTQPNWIYQRAQTQSVRTRSAACWSQSSL